MTTQDERTRSLLQAGAFLNELSRDTSVPVEIREEARRLIRHYPSASMLRLLASLDGGSNILAQDIKSSWFAEYRSSAKAGRA